MNRTTILLVGLLLLTLGGVRDTLADCYDAPECPLPPVRVPADPDLEAIIDAPWSTNTTRDGVYVDEWRTDDDAIHAIWAGVKGEQCVWDEGWGFEQAWNLDLPLSRLMNAAHIVRIVQQHARHQGFGFWRPVTDIPDDQYQKGHWWSFVRYWGQDEWEPSCEDGDANASYRETLGDQYYKLHIPGAYRYVAVNRASTLVHETTHEAVSHTTEIVYPCNPPSKSCDVVYGVFNSNTMQINFLHDAYATYRFDWVNGIPLPQVSANPLTNLCRWIPRFSEFERSQLKNRAQEVMLRFATVAYSGWITNLEVELVQKDLGEGVWTCDHCEPEEWTFDPDQCQQKACNELVNAENIGINTNNRTECEAYNASLAEPGSNEQTVAEAWNHLTLFTLGCKPAAGSEARNYCEAEKQSAGVVGDVDQCEWLDDHFSEAVTKLECVQEFCQEKFDSSGGWTVGQDPFGCMSYICDDDACGDSAGKQQCEQQFVAVHGDPALYMAPCEFNKCKKRLVDCLATAIQAGQWAPGDAIPTQCRSQETLCELISRLVFELAVDLPPHIDPGPLQELVERPENPNPGKNLTRYVETFRGAVEAGAPEDTLNRLAVRVTSTPELIAALYHRRPDVFVGLYGRGLTEVLGPGVEQMPARRISRGELSLRGQEAFDRFEQLLDAQGGTFEGAIGTFGQ